MTEAPCSDPTGAAWVHHILSRSGGMASVTWLNLFDREGFPVDGFIFADTGGEILETYTYLDVAREALAPYGIALTMVAMIGLNLYDTSWARPVIPPMLWRWSTRDYKVTPLLRHYWALGGHVHLFLTIAHDGAHRMKGCLARKHSGRRQARSRRTGNRRADDGRNA